VRSDGLGRGPRTGPYCGPGHLVLRFPLLYYPLYSSIMMLNFPLSRVSGGYGMRLVECCAWAALLLATVSDAKGLNSAGRVSTVVNLRLRVTQSAVPASSTAMYRPTHTATSKSTLHHGDHLRGGGTFSSSNSCDHLHQFHDEEVHQQLVALGGVDITSIIRRQPSCDELRDYLRPLVVDSLNLK
jgi:hypothetical protein